MSSQAIPWGMFSEKHKLYIRSCLKNMMSTAEGAVRSGKTVDHCIAAAAYLETCPDKIHLASGSSSANAKLNIGESNGFGLEHLFRGRCHWSKYKGNDALVIRTQTGEKVVVFAGAAKINSFQKILGNSYGLWIATEINQHHDSFIKCAFSRQLAAVDRKVLWDLNPSTPKHWIYTDYIDLYREKGINNYQHFTIADNATVSEERMAEILLQYVEGSVWHRRDILGERCAAEGLCYPQFANNTESFIIDKAPDDITMIIIGVDFGGNKSGHSFIANGITRNMREVVTLEDHYRKEIITPKQLDEDFVAFINKVKTNYPNIRAFEVNCDSEATVLIQGLKVASAVEHLPVDIKNAVKGEITGRIAFYNSLMAQGRYKIMRHCTNLIEAFQQAVWDPKIITEDVRLDNGTSNIDSLDACEYTTERLQKDIQQMGILIKRAEAKNEERKN